MEEENYPHCVSETCGEGDSSPAPASLCKGVQPHPGWAAEHNKASKDPKLTQTDLGRDILWDPEHHQGDLHHFSIL